MQIPAEIEVFDRRSKENVQGNVPELTQENFAKLCYAVTKRNERTGRKFDELETLADDLTKKLDQLENADYIIKNMKSDVQEISRIVSALRVEASELDTDR